VSPGGLDAGVLRNIEVHMKIGIIGAGHIGGTLASLLGAAGHDVLLSNSRGPSTLTDAVTGMRGVRAGTVEEAAYFGDVVIEAIPFNRYTDLPATALRGRIVVSASNYSPARDRTVVLGGKTPSEAVAEHLSGARVVKAFNTIYWEHVRDRGDIGKARDDRRVVPLASDDVEAKAVVAGIIDELGFGALDMGLLREGGRRMDPGQPIYNRDITLREARGLGA
jgi:hypothetical protein